MVVDEVTSLLSSEVSIWHLDDATLGCSDCFWDVHKCVTGLKKIGLEVNLSRCEVINTSYPDD